MEAKSSGNISYLWRSLLWGRSLAKMGGRWRIGNGCSIKAFDDAYVTDFSSGIPPSKVIDLTGSLVSEFIDVNGDWNNIQIGKFFLPVGAEAILRTPVNIHVEDKIFWKFSEAGRYTVKSPYLADIGFFEPPPNQQGRKDSIWNKLIWSRRLPQKIKIFIWRVFHDFIPSGLNLRSHHVPTSGLCEWCKTDWGTTAHSLFFCDYIKHTWKDTYYWSLLKVYRQASLVEIGIAMMNTFDEEEYEIWVVLTWMVWIFLCDLKHGRDNLTSEKNILLAKEYIKSFKMARAALGYEDNLLYVVGNKKWIAPEVGHYRVDVDARCDLQRGLFGIGAIVRNHKGEIKAALAKPIAKSDKVVELELIAACYGIGLCLQEELWPLILYSDSTEAVSELIKADEDSCLLPDGMAKTLADLKGRFIVDICHMLRSANSVAHCLAFHGANCDDLVIWTKDYPNWLTEIVRGDI